MLPYSWLTTEVRGGVTGTAQMVLPRHTELYPTTTVERSGDRGGYARMVDDE